MKKILAIAAIVAASVSMNAGNFFTAGVNDTVRIHPNRLNGYSEQVFTMQTDAYCDSWSIRMGYPKGTMVKLISGITPLSGMCVDYVNAQGEWACYEPQLQVSAAYANISATTADRYGYYDYTGNGVYIPYGTVKWEPGTRQMFSLNFFIEPTFRKGELTIDATFTASADSRGPILSNVRSYKTIWVWVGYQRGDINGDGRINITDATILIYALQEAGDEITYLDEFSIAAADLNDDGQVNVTDITILINWLNNA